MLSNTQNADEIKHKLRNFKKQEIKIRFNNVGKSSNIPSNIKLVWDEFFNLKIDNNEKAKYTLNQVVAMTKSEFKELISEFFFHVYYQYYRENGMVNITVYNPQILAHMGLAPDAGYEDIRKRFRELAKKYHPDTGGDSSKFIELMEDYKRLTQ